MNIDNADIADVLNKRKCGAKGVKEYGISISGQANETKKMRRIGKTEG